MIVESFEAFVVETSMLLALDVAILPPPEVARRAIELSAALPAREPQGLRLGDDMLPHITLTQQFITPDSLDAVLDCVGSTLAARAPLPLTVSGAGRGRSSVWMSIQLTGALLDLHRRLMDALQPFEQRGSTEAAFLNGDARPADVEWVAGFRQTSSDSAFQPHITLGHSVTLPAVEPVTFEATSVAACHLGKFCTCRRVLRRWELQARDSE
jgi:2'-5' RNA ligase